MPHKIEMAAGMVAAGAASSRIWLPTAEETVSMATDPIWGELLPLFGMLWLFIQIGFYLWDRLKRKPDEEDDK